MIVCKTADVELELLAQVKQQLIEYLSKSVIGLASLCFLDYNGEADSVPTDKPQLLWGTPYYQ